MTVEDLDKPNFADGTHEIDMTQMEGQPGVLELESIPYAAFVIGASGHVRDINLSAEHLVGHPRAEIVGERWDRWSTDLPAAREADTVQRAAGVRVISADSGSCIRHQSGRAIPVSVLMCPHHRDSFVAIVTPHSQGVDAGLRAADVAQIVHDLKNPLATIALEMCLLGDRLAGQGHPDLSSVVDRVTHNVEFLDRMVQDLLDSCAIDAGELALQRRSTELRSLLEQLIDRVIVSRERGRVVLEASRAITLSIDDLRIERVVANLLQNALKYAPKASRIVIVLAEVPGFARVSVTDAGPGMADDEKTFIFDKYRRTVGALAHPGSGLGLYVSKQIIGAHGGRIGVDSVQGGGSQFFFELPLDP